MVMNTGSSGRRARVGNHTTSNDLEVDDAETAEASERERFIAYIRALDADREEHSDVWSEHSYARGGLGAGGGTRVLLAPRRPRAASGLVDVEAEGAPRPRAPSPPPGASDRDDDEEEEDEHWERRALDAAPGAAPWLEALRAVRLARLAAGRRGAWAELQAAAGRLRLALAPRLARRDLVSAQRAVRGAIYAHGPGAARRDYERLVAELRKVTPLIADRLFGPETGLDSPKVGATSPASRGRGGASSGRTGASSGRGGASSERGRGAEGPLVAWVGADGWAARLRAAGARVVPLPLRAPRAPPLGWLTAAAADLRAAFADLKVHPRDSGSVFVGGCGAGAALAARLAAERPGAGRPGAERAGAERAGAERAGAERPGAGWSVRGVLLLAPPLETADPSAPPLPASEVDTLIVTGGASSWAWRGAVRGAGGGAGGGAGAGRGQGAARGGARGRTCHLELAPADDQLAAPGGALRPRGLPQEALDHAVADECVRWMRAVCDSDLDPSSTDTDECMQTEEAAAVCDDYAHLPVAGRAFSTHQRSIEIVEGRVVSRVSGGTPLALLPLARRGPPAPGPAPGGPPAAPPAPPATLAAADIMQLPIVFADDTLATPDDSQVTVTSGAGVVRGGGGGAGGPQLRRVIVAKRGARGERGERAERGERRGGRPLLLRRGLRIVQRE